MKQFKKAACCLAAAVMLVTCTSPAFAMAGDSEETGSSIEAETIITSVEETPSDTGILIAMADTATENTDTTASPDLNISFDISDSNVNGDGIFTPDGNLTLVDDIDEGGTEDLQYMTVQTKSGATFYIIIDRSTGEDNVYFLNTVDEADLIALMDDDTKAQYESEISGSSSKQNASLLGSLTGNDTEDSATGIDESDNATGSSDAGSSSKKTSTTGNPYVMLLIFAVLGGGAALAYYKLKIKPGKNKNINEEDMEFYDDEEYEEDEPELSEDDLSDGDFITEEELNRRITEDMGDRTHEDE